MIYIMAKTSTLTDLFLLKDCVASMQQWCVKGAFTNFRVCHMKQLFIHCVMIIEHTSTLHSGHLSQFGKIEIIIFTSD
jgi:hypothetical protein